MNINLFLETSFTELDTDKFLDCLQMDSHVTTLYKVYQYLNDKFPDKIKLLSSKKIDKFYFETTISSKRINSELNKYSIFTDNCIIDTKPDGLFCIKLVK